MSATAPLPAVPRINHGISSHFHGSVDEPGQPLPGLGWRVILQLPGGPAHSDFRLTKLLASIRALAPAVRGIVSRFVHLVDCLREPTAAERARLAALLTYGPRYTADSPAGVCLLVVPRPGTISPWSSKATDIALVCGLDGLSRIERGVRFYIDAHG